MLSPVARWAEPPVHGRDAGRTSGFGAALGSAAGDAGTDIPGPSYPATFQGITSRSSTPIAAFNSQPMSPVTRRPTNILLIARML